MIKYHYHASPRDVPRLGIAKGDRLCHVYSDTSLDELVAWGARYGLRPEWVHDGTLPHYDAFGERLAWCGPGVSRAELKEDLRTWRAKRDGRPEERSPRRGHLEEPPGPAGATGAGTPPREAPPQAAEPPPQGVRKASGSGSTQSSET